MERPRTLGPSLLALDFQIQPTDTAHTCRRLSTGIRRHFFLRNGVVTKIIGFGPAPNITSAVGLGRTVETYNAFGLIMMGAGATTSMNTELERLTRHVSTTLYLHPHVAMCDGFSPAYCPKIWITTSFGRWLPALETIESAKNKRWRCVRLSITQ